MAAGIVKTPCRRFLLIVNYIAVYNFRCPLADVIHPTNPLQLIARFELFRDAFGLFEFGY